MDLPDGSSSAEKVWLRNTEAVTINNCDRSDGVIRHVSQNINAFVGYDWSELIGKGVTTLFPDFPPSFAQLRTFEVEKTAPFKEYEATAITQERQERKFFLFCHLMKDWMVVELQPYEEQPVSISNERVGALMRSIQLSSGGIYSVLDVVAEEVYEVTGYDRVLIYEFDAEWNGCVIIEKSRLSPSFLGLHFPASDIPAQARRMYLRNRMRVIPDVTYRQQPIVPPMHPPLDLTHSLFRSVSPIHIQYLKNMNVGASLSISILVGAEARLWGLIVAHNAQPRQVPLSTHVYCNLVGKIASTQVETLLQRRQVQMRMDIERQLQRVQERALVPDSRKTLADSLAHVWEDLLSVFDADGMVFKSGPHETRWGAVGQARHPIVAWIMQHSPLAVFSTNSTARDLGIHCPDGLCCGFLSIPVPNRKEEFLVLFRSEFIREVEWGGQPIKADVNGVLNPRSSFASWKEIKKETSLPWSHTHIVQAEKLQRRLEDYVARSAQEQRRAETENERNRNEMLLRRPEVDVLAAIMGSHARAPDGLPPPPEILPSTDGASSLLSIIMEVLEMGTLDLTQPIEVQNAPFHFYEKLEYVLHSIHPVAANKGLFLLALVPVTLPDVLIADSSRLAQLLLNLLARAIVRGQAGAVSLEVSDVTSSGTQLELTFTVRYEEAVRDDSLARVFPASHSRPQVACTPQQQEEEHVSAKICELLATAMGGTLAPAAGRVSARLPLGRKVLEVVGHAASFAPYRDLPGLRRPAAVLLLQAPPAVHEFFAYYCSIWELSLLPADPSSFDAVASANRSAIQWIFSASSNLADLPFVARVRALMVGVPVILVQSPGSGELVGDTQHFDAVLPAPLAVSQLHKLLGPRAAFPALSAAAKGGPALKRKPESDPRGD